ncbi:hypothetical protein PF003_g31420 [Phytophthora fragariae]|nr:hypothetical protein PF003_g31420 [Phytophthora fragariae]
MHRAAQRVRASCRISMENRVGASIVTPLSSGFAMHRVELGVFPARL